MEIVLFNSPVVIRSPHSKLAPPLGLAYVASALMSAGYHVSAVDFNVSGHNLRRVENIIEWDKPAVVGISAHTETYPTALQIARHVRRLNENIRIVMGGPHPSIMPDNVLQEPELDFAVVGEGEETMVELVRYLLEGSGKPSRIKGLAYRDSNGSIRVNERRALLNPDSLPYPARDLFPLEFYEEKWNVLTARGGCPFKCPFCSASQIWGAARKARSPHSVVTELKMLSEQYGATEVFFTDDVFTLDRSRVYEMVRLLKELQYPITWGCATRVDCVDRNLIRDMASSGCVGIQYGIESGSQHILDAVKRIRKEHALEAVGASVAAGMKVTSSFMIPLPDDTVESIRETKEFMRQIIDAGSEIVISYTTPLPGTVFYECANELGLKILTDRWEEFDAKHNILETRHLSREQIDELVQEIVSELDLKPRV